MRKYCLKSGLKSAVIIGGAQLSGVFIGMLSIRVLTELATPEVFGISSLVLSLLVLGSHVFLSPITNTVLRYQVHAENPTGFMAAGIRLSYRNALFLSAFFAVGILAFFGENLRSSLAIAVASCCWIQTQAIKNILTSRLHAEANRLLFAFCQILESSAILLFCVSFLLLHSSVASVIFGQTIGSCASLLFVLLFAPWKIRGSLADQDSAEFKSRMISYGAPFAWLAIVNWTANMGDRFVLAWIAGPAITGTYIASFSIASRAITLCNSFSTDFFRPLVFKSAKEKKFHEIVGPVTQWIVCNLILCSIVLFLLFFLSEAVLVFLVSEEYRQSANGIILWIGIGYTIYGLTQILEICILALAGPQKLLLPMVTGGIASIALSVLLVPYLGGTGAAIASSLSFLSQLVATGLQLYTSVTRSNSEDVSMACKVGLQK